MRRSDHYRGASPSAAPRRAFAWNARNFDSLLNLYVDDLVYWSNFGGPDGGPNVVCGKPALFIHLTTYGKMECLSVPENFRLVNGHGLATASFDMRHLKTGLTH